MKNKFSKNNIPSIVSKWTDKYFHQSAFEEPLGFPSDKVIKFLSKFKPNTKIKLFRGNHKFNSQNFTGIKSWTYDKKIAGKYAKYENNSSVETKNFSPEEILLDTTLLNSMERKYIGYDFKVDDKEVLVFKK